MINRFAIVAASLLAVLLVAGHANAQINGAGIAKGSSHAFGSPTVSPYLNLQTVDNFGISAGYQTLVKPFVDARKAVNANSAAISRLQSQAGGGGRGVGVGGGGGGAPAASFMNYMHYYPGLSH